MQKRFFIVEKGSLDFLNVYILFQNGSIKNCSLQGSLGTKNGSSMASLQKHTFEPLFLIV